MNIETSASEWRRYGKLIVFLTSLTIIAASFYACSQYQKQKKFEEASMIYDTMMESFREKDLKKVSLEGEKLVSDYSGTPYASLGAMILARINVDRHNIPKAIDNLKLAMKLATEAPMAHIARVRLSRVLLSEDKLDEALSLLQENPHHEGYVTLYEEAKGDIFMKKNDLPKARASYLAALKSAPQGAPTTALQLKYSDIIENEKEGS